MRNKTTIFEAKRFAMLAWTTCLLILVALSGPLAAADTDGFLYGTLTTKKGKEYTGVFRWDGEEAFWDDLFNSGKTELPFLETHGGDKRGRRSFEVFGREINVSWGHNQTDRQFVVRFGDIAIIDVIDDSEAKLTMRDGTVLEVAGVGNDVEATIAVRDMSLGDVEVDWDDIERIEFQSTPASIDPEGFRLRGTVETEEGTFVGFVQWDKQECLSTDKLDGEEDGVKHAINMGNIRSIERRGRGASKVLLKDGRELILEGTNDVDDDNRGILVEDERFGRIEVPWEAFDKVTFDDAGPSGRPFEAYAKGGELHGRVVTADGETLAGRIVFDMDEAYTWELLDGNDDDVAYSIPFGLIAVIEPVGNDAARIQLRSGETLELENSQDVTDRNDGILVIRAEDEMVVPWESVDRIELDA